MANKKGYSVHLNEIQKKEIQRRYLMDENYKTIIKDYDCSSGTFWNICRNLKQKKLIKEKNRQLEFLLNLTEAEKGWIGGILDGEGWIGISYQVPKSKNRFPYLLPRISVCSTTLIMQQKLYSLCGGHIYYSKADVKKKPNDRARYIWDLYSVEKILPFLEAILPYLVVKKIVGEEVLAYCKRRFNQKFNHKRQSYEECDIESYLKSRELNHRGAGKRGDKENESRVKRKDELLARLGVMARCS